MNILFLSQIVPYPPDAGPKVKTWQVLRHLVEAGHQVSLACFVRAEERQYLPVLEQHFAHVYAVPIHRSRLADMLCWLRCQLSGQSFLIERDNLPGMRKVVADQIAAGQVDVIHADQLTMAQFALQARQNNDASRKPYLIFDAHNAVWTIMDRMRQNVPFYLRPVIAQEARRVKRQEGQIVRDFDQTLAVTGIDRLALLQAVAETGGEVPSQAESWPIAVIPIAVDTSQLPPLERAPESTNIVTLGTLHYQPNADGIRWFARQVFPLIHRQAPDTRLTIIGKNPPADFTRLAEQSVGAITVTGYVPDLTSSLQSAALMVIPVRAGGGMRVRILEAFSRAIPVVTTTIGLEGIQAEPGKDVLVADTPEDFAACVVRLLHDPRLREDLGKNSRLFVEQTYDWRIVLKKLDEVYERVNQNTAIALEA